MMHMNDTNTISSLDTIPKISVIVPIYNSEKFLNKCLDSIVNQTLREIEIILINDGSVDSSYQICERYAEYDKRIILINQENKGVSSARNAGIEKASGEYLGFVDSDDYIEAEMYSKLYNSAKRYDADLVNCDAIRNKNDFVLVSEFEKERVYDKGMIQDLLTTSNTSKFFGLLVEIFIGGNS